MYLTDAFEEQDLDKIIPVFIEYPFATVVSVYQQRPFISQLPLSYDRQEHCFYGHLARANPHFQCLSEQSKVLVLFQGPQAYVSPAWYDSPGVPTWNYQSVHIYGKPHLIAELEQLSSIVNELTGIYESALEKPWKPEYKSSMLNAIIGIEIIITDVQCKYKLSQNRSKNDRL